MITKRLIHNNNNILPQMKWATSTYAISKGLMFRFYKTVDKGMCLVMPSTNDVQFGASITMLFCFVDMEILFINSKFEVVDKKILKTWRPNYTPKKPCKFVIESTIGKFKDIEIGDLVMFK